MNPDAYADPIYENDQYIGPAFPDRVITARTNITLFNSLNLSALLEHQGGGFVQNNTGHHMGNRNVFGPCYPSQQAQRAAVSGNTEPLTHITAIWRARCTIVATQQREDNWFESTDFIKLRTITLTYELPEMLVPPRAQAATLSLSAGGNLWVKTDYSGTDPEARNNGATSSVGGTDYHSLPPYQTFVASLRVRF
jgi:hypothetical protein